MIVESHYNGVSMKKNLFLLISILSLTACFSPSQEQVDKAVQKELDKREEEKTRIYAVIDQYMKDKGPPSRANDQQGNGAPQKPSLEDQLKNPKHVDVGESPVKGAKSAKVTIVEFSDFQCPFCSNVNPTINEVMKKYSGKVKLTYKFLPLPMHPEAKIAAQAAVAAQKQGKFWEMHDLLFSHQTALKYEQLVGYAKDLGLDQKKFEKDMNDPKTMQRIEGEMKQAQGVGLGGTPSFLINGVTLVGAVPESEFSRIIDKIIKN